MASNGAGVRDIARTLQISKNTVTTLIKKKAKLLHHRNPNYTAKVKKVEIDEMQSYVKKKKNVRWVWSILDHYSGELLAYVIGRRTTANFHKLMALIDDLDIMMHYTDKLNIYKGFFEPCKHGISKYKMQRVERLHLTYRTRVKRLTRKTICSSKSLLMHDTTIGLFINQYLFGVDLVTST